jgi:hypothetical protein
MEDPKSGPLIRNYIPLTSRNGLPTLEELRQSGQERARVRVLPPLDEIESYMSKGDYCSTLPDWEWTYVVEIVLPDWNI